MHPCNLHNRIIGLKVVYTKNATLLKKQKRETVISEDDIINLKIAMNTMDFKTFIEKM